MIYLNGKDRFVPAVEMRAAVNGLENVLFHDFRMEHWQFLPMKRAFMDVLREDHRSIAMSEDAEYKEGMEKAQYFTLTIMAEAYPVLAYLKNSDADVKIGQYCCTFGDREISNYVVKVGEAVCDKKDGKGVWREGIYRISKVEPPEMKVRLNKSAVAQRGTAQG